MAEGGGDGGGSIADSGAARDKSRKMTKKNAPAALQTDVTNDEEWEKILERPGLVLVDIYSEWSGPCTGMVSILKKIKMEIGGDNLSYATARCDNISSLERFRGKSEPAWMFVRDGLMINVMFGANCPKLQTMLTKELKKVQKGEPPGFAIPVSETCPQEMDRMKAFEEAKAAKNAEKLAKLEAETKRKYEAQMVHYLESLKQETCLILFPWHFVDEEGNKRDKKASPAYAEIADKLLSGNYVIDQEIRVQMDEDILTELQKETEYIFSKETKRLFMADKCHCIRLKFINKMSEYDIDQTLINLLYGEPEIPDAPEKLLEDCFVQRNLPPLKEYLKETTSSTSSATETDDNLLDLTTVWVPLNSRNRVLAFYALFTKYVDKNYPYVMPEEDIPTSVFKYDSTRRKELQVVLEAYEKDVIHFGVFERDKLPEPKLIARSINYYENEIKEKTGYEVFVAVIKKIGAEAFLSFAGIGPYYVSETSEAAKEEALQYFSAEGVSFVELVQSDDDKDIDGEEYEGEGMEGMDDDDDDDDDMIN